MKNIVGNKINAIVESITPVTESIKRFKFIPEDGGEMPVFAGGAHIVVEMPDGDIIRRNPYSLMGNIDDRSSYSISVLQVKEGRGGSNYMHNNVKEGDKLTISYPVNLFALGWKANKHLLIAGGIGITPIISQAQTLMQRMLPFEMHYIARSEEKAAYLNELAQLYGKRFHFHVRNKNNRWSVDPLLLNQPVGTHVYACGPEKLMNNVVDTCTQAGWDKSTVHIERFLAPASGKPYTIELKESQKHITVRKNQSMLEAIEQAGVNPPYLCRGGACGQCETQVVSFSGTLSHHDHFLSDEEKASGKKIMPCVSRVEGDNPHIVLER